MCRSSLWLHSSGNDGVLNMCLLRMEFWGLAADDVRLWLAGSWSLSSLYTAVAYACIQVYA